jgi:hypothetical protein
MNTLLITPTKCTVLIKAASPKYVSVSQCMTLGSRKKKNMWIPVSRAGMTPDCAANGELFECEITRKEFEQASNPLVERTINTFSSGGI